MCKTYFQIKRAADGDYNSFKLNLNNIYPNNKLLKRREYSDLCMNESSSEYVFKIFYFLSKDLEHMHARDPFKGIIQVTVKILISECSLKKSTLKFSIQK